MTKYWSCDLWGRMTTKQTDNPACECSMCERWRSDSSKRTPKKKKSRTG